MAEPSSYETQGAQAAPRKRARRSRRRSSVFRRYTKCHRCRIRTWDLVDDPTSSDTAYWISIFLLILIFVSTIFFVLETVDALREGNESMFLIIEAICIGFFTAEVLVRVFVCPDLCKFALDLFNWIDVLAIVPFYVELIIPDSVDGAGSFGVIRVVRLVRVARVVKVSRYSQSIRIFSQAIRSSLRPLSMLCFLVTIAMVVFSSGVYYAEFTPDGCRQGEWRTNHGPPVEVCDDELSDWTQIDDSSVFRVDRITHVDTVVCVCRDPNPFTSIPATFWWCIVTMTTVGYGDAAPVTEWGKLVAVLTMVSGIIILALPITVIGTNFARVLREIQSEKVLAMLDFIDVQDGAAVDVEQMQEMLERVSKSTHTPLDALPTAEDLMDRFDVNNDGVFSRSELLRVRASLTMQVAAYSEGKKDKAEAKSFKKSFRHAKGLEKTPEMEPRVQPLPTAPTFTAAPTAHGPGPAGDAGDAEEDFGRPDTAEDDPVAPNLGDVGPSPSMRSTISTRSNIGGGDAIALQAGIKRRLDAMEAAIDDRLAQVVELLRVMNAAVAQHTSSEAVL